MSEPTISLAGQTYEIPKLAIKQLRELDWRILSISPVLTDRRLMTKEVRDAFFDIVYIALTKANPELTRKQFDDLGITLIEALNAMSVIIAQTGLFKPAAESAPSTGEASTGTES